MAESSTLEVPASGSWSTNHSQELSRPNNLTIKVLSLEYQPDGGLQVEYRIKYPARTAAEAARAKNHTLDPHWFEGPKRVQRIRDELQNNITYYNNRTYSRLDNNPEDSNDPAEQGEIVTLKYSEFWRGTLINDKDIRISEPYVANLEEGWNLVLITRGRWEPSIVSGNPEKDTAYGEAAYPRYSWTITEDMDTPLLVIEDPAITTDEEAPLGVAGGVILTLAALLGAVGMARYFNGR